MTVTEFATLEVLPPHDGCSPFVQDFLRKVAALQSATSGYPMLFFKDASNPTTVYILAGWANAEAHQKWVESEGNKELLAEMLSNIAVKELIHLDIDFTKIPVDATAIRLSKFSRQAEPKEAAGGLDSSLMWEGVGECIESNGNDAYSVQVRSGERQNASLDSERPGGKATVINMFRLPY